MKIIVNKKPYVEDEINEYFSTKAVFKSNEDSSVEDILNMLSKVLYLEGYSEVSLVHAMQEYVNNALQNGIDLSIFANSTDAENL